MSSVAFPLEAAITERLLADSFLVDIVGPVGVHNGIAPPGTVKPFIVFSDSSEAKMRLFQRAGWESREVINIFARDRMELLTIFGHMARLMTGHKFTLTEPAATVRIGRLRLINTMPTQDNTGFQAAVEYTAKVIST